MGYSIEILKGYLEFRDIQLRFKIILQLEFYKIR